MFGSIGGAELLVILVVALMLFGPRKLPQIGRSIGRAMAEFRGAANEFKANLERDVELDDLKHTRAELDSAGREAAHPVKDLARQSVARGSLAAGDVPTPDAAADEKS